MMKRYSWLIPLLVLTAHTAQAQQDPATEKDKVTVTGSIQSDILLPQEDAKIGSPDYKEWALTNSYLDLNVMSRYVDEGARFEYVQH